MIGADPSGIGGVSCRFSAGVDRGEVVARDKGDSRAAGETKVSSSCGFS
jgi:hypothetical protein